MANKIKKSVEQISLDDLKRFLWGAAVRLRGQIDASGYKEYIFPLLFFKRICDVFDEQYETFVSEGGEEYAKLQLSEMPIQIPEGSHWNDVRESTVDVGRRLRDAFIAIEQANPGKAEDGRVIGGLTGIFGAKDIWTNKEKMPDHIITSMIEDFSKYTLSLRACPADEMGLGYEYLIGQFATDAGNTAQEFYTNRTVVTLMAEILQPKPDETIYDPTCGSGGMLVKCLNYLQDKGEEWRGVKLFGQEVNVLTASIARMNLYLNGVEDFSIACNDTLKYPEYLDGSQLRKFDVVLANPPYSIKNWDREAFANDKWGRNFLGVPPQGRADYAFIQHILASMDPQTGRCAILLPHGVLFREDEREIRKALIEKDLVEAVIGLGPNLFFNASMEACILICRSKKDYKLKNKIVFINAVNEVTRKNAESFLEPVHINRIKLALDSDKEILNLKRIIGLKEIELNCYDLSIQKYVQIIDGSASITLDNAKNILFESQKKLRSELNNLIKLL